VPFRAVLIVGGVLRLVVLSVIAVKYPKDWLFTRGMEMGLLAKSLLAGNGLSSPFGVPTGPTAFIAPGYPILIAGIFKVFGVYSFASALVVMLLQLAINVLTIRLLMQLALELFDRRTAAVSGWIWACSLPLLWLPTIFWDTSISICALVAAFLLALRIQHGPTLKLWVGMGAFCGVVALINPALLLVLLAIIAWAAWQAWPASRYGSLLTLLTLAVVFSPWPIRNARVFHAFVPLRTTVGFEMWMGNHPGSSGFLEESLFPMFNAAELAEYRRVGEIGYTARKSELAKEYILANPGTFAKLTLRRIARFWTGAGTENGSMLFVIHATVTSLLGFIGLGLLLLKRRLSQALLFLIPIVLFPAPYYLTHAEFRYRLVIDPEVVLLAAYALVWFFADRKQQESFSDER